MSSSKTVLKQKILDSEIENDSTYKAIMRGLEDIKAGRVFVWHRRSK